MIKVRHAKMAAARVNAKIRDVVDVLTRSLKAKDLTGVTDESK